MGICEGAAEGVGPRGGEGLSHFLGDAIGCWGGGRGRGSSGSVGFFFFFFKKNSRMLELCCNAKHIDYLSDFRIHVRVEIDGTRLACANYISFLLHR